MVLLKRVPSSSGSGSLPPGIEMQANKNQPNGYPGLDAQGNMTGTLIVRYDLAANIDQLVLEAGEMAVTSDTNEIRVGNGIALGGVVNNPNNSQQCIAVTAAGTPAQNGLSLINAYDAARNKTPNGLPIGPENRLTVLLFPGRYDIGAVGVDLVLDVPYINLASTTSSATCRIVTSDQREPGLVRIMANNVHIQGIEFCAPDQGPMMFISVSMAGSIHRDLVFTATRTLGIAPATFFPAVGFTRLSGYYSRCSANCGGLYGAIADSANCTVDAVFEDCTALVTSFGSGDSDLTTLVAPGRLTRCHLGPTGGLNFGGGLWMINKGLIEYCYVYDNYSSDNFGPDVPAVTMGEGGELFYSTVIHKAGQVPGPATAIGSEYMSVPTNANFAHNSFSLPGVDPMLTNGFGATLASAMNIESALINR
jgi:hypothetical protein